MAIVCEVLLVGISGRNERAFQALGSLKRMVSGVMVDMWNVVIGGWLAGHRLALVHGDKDEASRNMGCGASVGSPSLTLVKDSGRSKLEGQRWCSGGNY